MPSWLPIYGTIYGMRGGRKTSWDGSANKCARVWRGLTCFFRSRKIKLKIENNVKKKVKKVLQNGYKYPQNSLYSFFISFLNGYGHILTFKIGIGEIGRFEELFTFVFTKSSTKTSFSPLQNGFKSLFVSAIVFSRGRGRAISACSCPRSCSVVVEPSQLVRVRNRVQSWSWSWSSHLR